MLKKIISGYIIWKILIFIFAALAIYILPVNDLYSGGKLAHDYPYWLRVWANFDGFHYMRVAYRGYFTFNLPFFPLYPFMIRSFIELIPGNSYYLLTGLIISHLTFICALIIMIRLLKVDKKLHHLGFFLMVLFLFPTSFYYGAVYNDSLFLMFAVLCIYFSRKNHWVYAGIAGALATLTRLNGLALTIYVVFEYLTSDTEKIPKTWDFKRLWTAVKTKFSPKQIWDSRIYAVSLIPLAYIGFLTYIQIKFGDWRLIHKAMAAWDQDKVTFPLQVFWRYIKILTLNSPGERTYWVAMVELGFVLFYTFMLWVSWRKIRLSYWILIAISFLIPSLTGTFAGMPRYALHLYPFFLAITTFFAEEEPPYAQWIYFIISIAMLFMCLTFYTRGYFIA
jgi:hypothetical protein